MAFTAGAEVGSDKCRIKILGVAYALIRQITSTLKIQKVGQKVVVYHLVDLSGIFYISPERLTSQLWSYFVWAYKSHKFLTD